MRVLHELPNAELVGVLDTDESRASAAAAQFACSVFRTPQDLRGKVDAAVVAVPTSAHAAIGCQLIETGIDTLVEKPIAPDRTSAQQLVDAARRFGRVLQVGHLERFNPAIVALKRTITLPLFFEIHRLSLFSPRSLDVDVVLDLMIHDLDVVLDLVGAAPDDIRAAGLSILSDKINIANVRLAFPTGCIANLTASRVSTERIRKLRLFQPHEYISLDYSRQEAAAFAVKQGQQIDFHMLPVEKGEPLRAQLEHFLDCVVNRSVPRVSGADGLRALDCALSILEKIEQHTRLVTQQLKS